MSYQIDRIMSIGSSCQVADMLKSLNIREPGPVDYCLSETGICGTPLSLFTGSFHNSILNKEFKSYGYFDEDTDCTNHTLVCGTQYIHQDLSDKNEYQKIVHRSVMFNLHLKTGGKFIYLTNSDKETDYRCDRMLNYFKSIKFDLENRLIIIKGIERNHFTGYNNIEVIKDIKEYYSSPIVAKKCNKEFKEILIKRKWIYETDGGIRINTDS